MSSPCDLVQDFFDGELEPAQAETYRQHAATCARCQRKLMALAQLHALEVKHLQGPAGEPVDRPSPVARLPRPGPAPRWLWAAGGAGVALAAMLVVGIFWWTNAWSVPDSTWDPGAGKRWVDARSAFERARKYRPPELGVLGPSTRAAPSHEVLGRLEHKGEPLGKASALLLLGTKSGAEEAGEILEKLKPSADVLSEMAFMHLVRRDKGDAEEALRLTDRALALDPQHGPALWNRALALEALQLQFVAARAFEAAAALGEPGWSEEARQRATSLLQRGSGEESDQAKWSAANEAGKQLVIAGVRPRQELLGVAVLRHWFYDAVRARRSRAEVLDLLPLAQQMDARAGDAALAKYVTDVSSQDFAVRAPLATAYRHLTLRDQPVDTAWLLQQLRRQSGQADLLIGTLAKVADEQPGELDPGELERLAGEVRQDAWLATLAMRLKGTVFEREGRLEDAQKALQAALERCARPALEYRRAELELKLSWILDKAEELVDAETYARQGWADAQDAKEWGREEQFILELAQLSRHRNDLSVSRAYYEEGLERTPPEQLQYAHEGLTNLAVQRMDYDEARRHLDAALKLASTVGAGGSLGLVGALALGDVARVKPDPGRDEAAMRSFRAQLDKWPKGDRALAEHALGRWAIERDPQEGKRWLRSSIALATAGDLMVTDQAAQRALGYSYTSLLFEAGKRHDAGTALQLFQEEWLSAARGGPPVLHALPERCLLAVAVDSERVMAVVRDAADGAPLVWYDAGLRAPLPKNLESLLPLDLKERLAGCASVGVLARSPVYGHPGLLPSSVAWSYLHPSAPRDEPAVDPVGPGVRQPVDGRQEHLVVGDVALSEDQQRSLDWPPGFSTLGASEAFLKVKQPDEELIPLTGKAANRLAVLSHLSSATTVTFLVHGRVRSGAENAYLLLAGGDTLRASDVRKIELRGHPLVLLASCEGAQPELVFHQAQSLPLAFLQAGARAVLAASDPVPAGDGPRFFAAVRARIRNGTEPAEALRAERALWIARNGRQTWLDGVLLFV